MGGGFFRPVTKALGGVGKAIGLVQDVKMPAPQPAPETPAPAATPAATPTDQSANTETGVSNEKAQRKGKKAVTIQRGDQGSGSGLNV